eukprot:COSAG04_NODE_111_length_25781_cov_90.291761_18_plen_720_part_00
MSMDDEVKEWLRKLNLSQLEQDLVALGVEEISDVQFIEEGDVQKLKTKRGLKPIQVRKLRKAIEKQQAEEADDSSESDKEEDSDAGGDEDSDEDSNADGGGKPSNGSSDSDSSDGDSSESDDDESDDDEAAEAANLAAALEDSEKPESESDSSDSEEDPAVVPAVDDLTDEEGGGLGETFTPELGQFVEVPDCATDGDRPGGTAEVTKLNVGLMGDETEVAFANISGYCTVPEYMQVKTAALLPAAARGRGAKRKPAAAARAAPPPKKPRPQPEPAEEVEEEPRPRAPKGSRGPLPPAAKAPKILRTEPTEKTKKTPAELRAKEKKRKKEDQKRKEQEDHKRRRRQQRHEAEQQRQEQEEDSDAEEDSDSDAEVEEVRPPRRAAALKVGSMDDSSDSDDDDEVGKEEEEEEEESSEEEEEEEEEEAAQEEEDDDHGVELEQMIQRRVGNGRVINKACWGRKDRGSDRVYGDHDPGDKMPFSERDGAKKWTLMCDQCNEAKRREHKLRENKLRDRLKAKEAALFSEQLKAAAGKPVSKEKVLRSHMATIKKDKRKGGLSSVAKKLQADSRQVCYVALSVVSRSTYGREELGLKYPGDVVEGFAAIAHGGTTMKRSNDLKKGVTVGVQKKMGWGCETVSGVIYNRYDAQVIESETKRVFEQLVRAKKIKKKEQLLWRKRLEPSSKFGCKPAEGDAGAKGAGPWVVSIVSGRMDKKECCINW